MLRRLHSAEGERKVSDKKALCSQAPLVSGTEANSGGRLAFTTSGGIHRQMKPSR